MKRETEDEQASLACDVRERERENEHKCIFRFIFFPYFQNKKQHWVIK